jgi:hypothetical protein
MLNIMKIMGHKKPVHVVLSSDAVVPILEEIKVSSAECY